MNAPDKLYLHGYPDKPFLCQDWDVAPTKRVVRGQQAENIEYIRKDALLDKLNLALKLRGDGNPNSDGVQTIRAMINYIESL